MINILGGAVPTSLISNFVDYRSVDIQATNRFHHRQVLEIVMGLEQSIAGVEFHKDAADAPDVTREAPSKIEDDLRCSVMSGRDYGGMVLVVKCSGAKVDKPDLRIEQDSALFRCAGCPSSGRGDRSVVCEGLVGI